ncbi:MAG: hypothetical protein HY208_05495 [Nitrospirae bacterium]|nr:hypothetical protein [Nitrospirota bacterium]
MSSRPCERSAAGAERGGALVLVLLVLLLFTLLGAAAVQMGANEIEQSGLQAAQQQAGDLAESGVELVIGGFARPERFAGRLISPAGPCPSPGRVQALLTKRCTRLNGRASFSTEEGESQFQGTPAEPDGAIHGTASELFPPSVRPPAGSTVDVIVYGPITPGAICTVQSTGRTAGGAGRTLRVELYEAAVPVLTAAAGAGEAGTAVAPVRAHWGGLRYDRDGRLPADPNEAPVMTPLASVDGRPYAGLDDGEGRFDRWMDVVIGGRLLAPSGPTAADATLARSWTDRGNVRIGVAAPTDVDSWPYGELKRWARRFGRYYTTDPEGRLYLDGRFPAGGLDEVLEGDDEPVPLIFIDTIDGQPPRSGPGGNLPTLTLSRSTGFHRVFIGGHLVLRPSILPDDAPLVVSSPLGDGESVTLHGVAFTGGFFVAGRLTVARESRVFGAIYAGGGFEGTEQLELWYDRRLGDATRPGWPVVSLLPGSWRVVTP